MLEPITGFCWSRLYLRALERHPLATKSTTAAIVSMLASVVAQRSSGRPFRRLNSYQVRNEAVIGFVIRGALVHYWHRLLGRIVSWIMTDRQSKPNFLVAVVMMLIDQTIFAPVMIFAYLMLSDGLNGRSFRQIYANLKKSFIPILQRNYQIWPVAALINFHFVPAPFRVAFSNAISFFWTIYLITVTTATHPPLSPSERERLYFKERSD